jgi:hypothetical protein
VADKRTRTPNADHSDDALATMSEHLARFFEQADTLLEEWKTYGDALRASLDTQARDLEATIAQAIENAGREASGALSAHMDESLHTSLERLRHEVDAMSERLRAAGQSAGRGRADTNDPSRAVAVHHDAPAKARPWQSGVVLLGLTLANVMLAVLLVSSIRSCRGQVYEHRSGSGWGTPPADANPGARDAGAPGPGDAAAPAQDAGTALDDAGQKIPSSGVAPKPGQNDKSGKSGGKSGGKSSKSSKSKPSAKSDGKSKPSGTKREQKGSSP